MDDPNKTQSFIIRIWHENPRLWRGTIRHVQSDSHRGVTRLDQVSNFLEQHADVSVRSSTTNETQETSQLSLLRTRIFSRRAMVPIWGAAIGVAVLVLVILLAMPGSNLPLNATAVGDSVGFEIVLAFVAGVVTSAILIGLWFKIFRK